MRMLCSALEEVGQGVYRTKDEGQDLVTTLGV